MDPQTTLTMICTTKITMNNWSERCINPVSCGIFYNNNKQMIKHTSLSVLNLDKNHTNTSAWISFCSMVSYIPLWAMAFLELDDNPVLLKQGNVYLVVNNSYYACASCYQMRIKRQGIG